MEVICPTCSNRVEVEMKEGLAAARASCNRCGTTFLVRVKMKKKGEGEPGYNWFVRKQDGTMMSFPSNEQLQLVIRKGLIDLEDEISADGERWTKISSLPVLSRFLLKWREEATAADSSPTQFMPQEFTRSKMSAPYSGDRQLVPAATGVGARQEPTEFTKPEYRHPPQQRRAGVTSLQEKRPKRTPQAATVPPFEKQPSTRPAHSFEDDHTDSAATEWQLEQQEAPPEAAVAYFRRRNRIRTAFGGLAVIAIAAGAYFLFQYFGSEVKKQPKKQTQNTKLEQKTGTENQQEYVTPLPTPQTQKDAVTKSAQTATPIGKQSEKKKKEPDKKEKSLARAETVSQTKIDARQEAEPQPPPADDKPRQPQDNKAVTKPGKPSKAEDVSTSQPTQRLKLTGTAAVQPQQTKSTTKQATQTQKIKLQPDSQGTEKSTQDSLEAEQARQPMQPQKKDKSAAEQDTQRTPLPSTDLEALAPKPRVEKQGQKMEAKTEQKKTKTIQKRKERKAKKTAKEDRNVNVTAQEDDHLTGNFDSLMRRGDKYRNRRQYAKAVPIFRKLAQLRPNHPEANYKLADCLRRLGNCAEALNYYKKAIQLSRFKYAYWGIGKCLVELGRVKEAVQYLETGWNEYHDQSIKILLDQYKSLVK